MEKPLVLKVFLKEAKGAIAFQECEKLIEKGGFGRKSDLKTRKRKKKGASRSEMASMMHI